MGCFTKQEAEAMGAFEETALDTEDALAAEVSLQHAPAVAQAGENSVPPGDKE